MAIRPWRRTRSRDAETRRDDRLRAARLLELRSRRQATGLFAGHYASAFRGGGMVFEESRPYVPGDDVRRMDWNAMARTGLPFVKHHHEERNRTVQILLDTSASMAFRSGRDSLAHVGARVAALLVAVAARAGDRVGLVTSGDGTGGAIAPARGPAHAWRIVETVTRTADRPHGGDGFEAAIERTAGSLPADAVVFLISDFRAARRARPEAPPVAGTLAGLGARSDLVCVVLEDPRDRALPDAGRVRIADPERPGRTLLLDTGDRRVRARYAEQARARRRALERDLHRAGSDVVWLPADHDPLRVLARAFQERAARLGVAPA